MPHSLMGMSHEALRSTMGALDDRKSGQYRSTSIRSVCISQFGDVEKMKSQGLWEQCLSLMAAMQSSEIAPNEMLGPNLCFPMGGRMGIQKNLPCPMVP